VKKSPVTEEQIASDAYLLQIPGSLAAGSGASMDRWLTHLVEFLVWLSDAWVRAPEVLGFPPEWALLGLVLAFVSLSIGRNWPPRRGVEPVPHPSSTNMQQPGGVPGIASDALCGREPSSTSSWDELRAAHASTSVEMTSRPLAPPIASQAGGVGLLGPPPRRLTLALVVRVLLPGWQQAAWVFLGLGSLLAVALVSRAEIAWSLRAGAVAQADGVALDHFATDVSQKGIPVHGTRYRFAADGRIIEGVSYALGHYHGPGEAIRIEYARNDPQRSRITGMRSAVLGPGVLLVLIAPAVALLLIAWSLRSRLRSLHLLRNGLLAYGRCVDKRKTPALIDQRPVFELDFEFRTHDGRCVTTVLREHRPERLEGKAEKALLYDPGAPANSAMADALPGDPLMLPDGVLSGGGSGALRLLLLPMLAVGLNALFVWFKLSG
jgi:hypothetical protein